MAAAAEGGTGGLLVVNGGSGSGTNGAFTTLGPIVDTSLPPTPSLVYGTVAATVAPPTAFGGTATSSGGHYAKRTIVNMSIYAYGYVGGVRVYSNPAKALVTIGSTGTDVYKITWSWTASATGTVEGYLLHRNDDAYYDAGLVTSWQDTNASTGTWAAWSAACPSAGPAPAGQAYGQASQVVPTQTFNGVSTSVGGIIPGPTTATRIGQITPIEGQQVYDTTNHVMKWWNGSAWKTAATL
jgi:hypothetical protein